MLVDMEERRQADLPWANAPLAARIVVAVVVAAPAVLMANSLTLSRGLFVGVILGLFWGVLAVLVVVFPRTLQGWARNQPLFAPALTLGVLLFGLVFLTAMPTAIAVFFSVLISGILAFIAVGRRRRTTAPPPRPMGRR